MFLISILTQHVPAYAYNKTASSSFLKNFLITSICSSAVSWHKNHQQRSACTKIGLHACPAVSFRLAIEPMQSYWLTGNNNPAYYRFSSAMFYEQYVYEFVILTHFSEVFGWKGFSVMEDAPTTAAKLKYYPIAALMQACSGSYFISRLKNHLFRYSKLFNP
ncbi:hypothetical protein [Ferruginibacter sp.]|uniref:hypothetical protein n=1 Tax=Ferruginibacter sp. TaxID=1940288 RepID=UPI00265A83F0|nr:hypothetical protein [Ferruginibacter sp.]